MHREIFFSTSIELPPILKCCTIKLLVLAAISKAFIMCVDGNVSGVFACKKINYQQKVLKAIVILACIMKHE